jgi:hypothetical protein
MDIKALRLEDIDWTSEDFTKKINNEISEAIEHVINNMASQIHTVANLKGTITLFLKPLDLGDENDNYIDIKYDADGLIITIEIIKAIKEEVDSLLKHEDSQHWIEHKKKLTSLAYAIIKQAERFN